MKKDKKFLKIWGIACAILLAGSATLTTLGCLTPQQQAIIAEGEMASSRAAALILDLNPQIARVQKWIDEKKVDPEEGKEMLKILVSKKDELKATVEDNKDVIAKMKAAQTPWYGYLLYGVNVLAGIAGAAMGIRKVGAVTSAFGSASRGFESVLDNMDPGNRTGALAMLERRVDADGNKDLVKLLHNKAITGKI